MSKQSEAVKRWRKATKTRMVQAMGGRCACCGYSTCEDAMEFHHIDPSQKELDFGKGTRANCKSWDTIVQELRKCILLCANCHREIHAGIRILPADPQQFDENFAAYKKAGPDTPCKKCGKPKPETQAYCSRTCAASAARKVDWDSVDLVTLLQHKTKAEIADQLSISWCAVDKRAKKLGL